MKDFLPQGDALGYRALQAYGLHTFGDIHTYGNISPLTAVRRECRHAERKRCE
jgi:hypothetical protein